MRISEPDVVGDRAAEKRRPLRQPGDVPPPLPRIAGGEVGARDCHSSRGRLSEFQEERGDGALAAAALADERDGLAGAELEVEQGKNEARSLGVRERDAFEAHRRVGGARRDRSSRDGTCLRLVDQVEHPIRDREAVGACVELRAEPAQRLVQLGREHEHGQAGFQPDAPVHEADADSDRRERDTERRREFQHRAGEETHPQRRHRRLAVPLARLCHPRGLLLAAVEGAKRRQTAHDVEKVRRQQPERLPAPARLLLRVAADQPHEDGHEGQRQQQDERRRDVDGRNPGQHRDRHDAREDDLGQVAREVRLEAVHTLNRGGRDLRARAAVTRCRLPQSLFDQLQPQAGQNARRRLPSRDLESPREYGTAGEDKQEKKQRSRDRMERGAVERACDDAGEERRLEQQEQRRSDPDRRVDCEQHAHGPCAAQEAPVERAH